MNKGNYMKLQEWANENKPDSNVIYKKGYWNQIIFIRDQVPSIFANDFDEYRIIQDLITVVSTHTSKSIVLPVYKIITDCCDIYLRNNFYDWKVSINSIKDIKGNFKKLFGMDDIISYLYCEGFKKEWVFGSYNENKSKFTIELRNDYHLYTFLWIIATNN